MSSQINVVLKVSMSCQGCAGAVRTALANLEGVESFNVDLEEQKVTVKGNVQPETVFETVSKTGKKTSFWEEPVSAPASASASHLGSGFNFDQQNLHGADL